MVSAVMRYLNSGRTGRFKDNQCKQVATMGISPWASNCAARVDPAVLEDRL